MDVGEHTDKHSIFFLLWSSYAPDRLSSQIFIQVNIALKISCCFQVNIASKILVSIHTSEDKNSLMLSYTLYLNLTITRY